MLMHGKPGLIPILKTYEIHVNACITVKIVGGISLSKGGKLEEAEGSNCFFLSFLCVCVCVCVCVCQNENRSALVCELLSNKSLFVGQL